MQKKALRYALISWLFLRIYTSLTLAFLTLWIPVWFTPLTDYSPELLARLENVSPASRLLLAPWYRWDTTHFLDIADTGYESNLRNTGWLPLYPALIRLAKFIFPETLLAALVVSNLAAVAAFYLFFVLLTEIWGEITARKGLLYLITFPTAFILVAAYSESLFLALIAGCFLAIRKKMWLTAGLMGMLANLTRFQGIVLLVPVAWEGIRAWQALPHEQRKTIPWRWITGCLLMPAGFGLFITYTHFGLGAPFPWEGLTGWTAEHFGWPWIGFAADLKRLYELILTGGSFLAALYICILTIMAFYILFAAFKKIPISYSLFLGGTVLLNLAHQLNFDLTTPGAARYMATILPLFVGLALIIQRKIATIVWIGLSFSSQIILLVGFYWWVWNG